MATLPPAPRPDRSLRPLLWLVAAAIFMQSLDATIVNTALPAIARDLARSPLQMQAVVFSYSLAMAVLIPASGWLADRLGTRRVFLLALAVFTAGSLCCAAAWDVPSLVAARVLQGAGGAFLMPVGRLAVLRAVPREQFLGAMSFIAIPAMVGPLLGPAVGGWLVAIASWHWIFLVNLPIGLAGLVAAWRILPAHQGGTAPRFDLSGYLLLACGMVALALALDGLSDGALPGVAILLLAIGGLGAMLGYWLHAAQVAAPLFPPSLFVIPSFRTGLAGNLFSRVGSGAMPMPMLVPLMLQLSAGLDPLHAGLMMVPMTLAGMASKQVVVRLVLAFGYRRVLVVNTVLVGLAMASFALFDPARPLWVQVLHMAAFGAVNALQFSAMNTITLRGLDDARASAGNSLLSMVMMLANGFGVAVAGSLLAAFSRHQAPVAVAMDWTFLCVGGVTAATALLFSQLPDQVPAPQPPATGASPAPSD